jgi:hypothetical protein
MLERSSVPMRLAHTCFMGGNRAHDLLICVCLDVSAGGGHADARSVICRLPGR